MREVNMDRLNSSEIDSNHSLYLHYTFYHRDLFSAIDKYANGRLLDIGCGNKPYLKIIEKKVVEYIGCDVIQSSDNKVDIISNATNIPVTSESFDTILSTQTIEHIEDPQGLIYEAMRILRPNSFLILSAPMYWPLHEEPYDFFRFTKHGLTHLLNTAGFEIVSIHSNGGKFAVAGQALIHAIFPTVYNIKGLKGKIIRTIFTLFGGIKTINRLFAYVDEKFPDHSNTMNYVFAAKK